MAGILIWTSVLKKELHWTTHRFTAAKFILNSYFLAKGSEFGLNIMYLLKAT
jgi:hypothetical protein